MKYASTYQHKDGVAIYEHDELFYHRYCAMYGDDGHFEKIDNDAPVIPYRVEKKNVASFERGSQCNI
jgi:hypothetical protein